MANGKKLFVTKIEETARFEKIVKRITTDGSVLKLLFKLGFDFLQVQIGTGLLQVSISADLKPAVCKMNNFTTVKFRGGLNLILKYNHSFEEFDEEIKKADLVISDADVGSCSAVLKRNKPLLVVITEDMMDTRKLQSELAGQLPKNGHLNYCTVDNLEDGLITAIKAYSKADKNLFAKYLGKCLGFFTK